MCRLYAFHATEPTKVECTLVHAQNALMSQSRSDLSGTSHTHGWGVATFDGGLPDVERQTWAAYHGEHFQRRAARIYAETVIAHIRRATVGGPAPENTHPFTDGRWVFAHNGTVPNFDAVRPKILGAMSPTHRAAIKGATDSEHVFRLIRTLQDETPSLPLKELIRTCIKRVIGWCHEIDAEARIGLNLMLSDGVRLAGSRYNRTLHYVVRDGVYDCEICGFPHIHHEPSRSYRAIVVASEPITSEHWELIPDETIYEIVPGAVLQMEPL